MTKYRWGTIFFVPSSWDGDDDSFNEAVVESHPNQVSAFGKARALLRIAGREDKATKIDKVLDRALAQNESVLRADDLTQLDVALEGIEDALKRARPDWANTLSGEEVALLRVRYPALDFSEVAGWVTTHSLLPSLAEAEHLRVLLRDAHERGLHVLLDYSR